MKTAETLRVKGLAEVTNEKNSTSNSAQDEPGHRSVPRTESPTPQSKRRRGRVRKRSLSDSNRSDDSNEPKIKQPVSPDIEELSGDITMDNSGQFSSLQSQVPMQSLPSHSTNSYHKSSSVVSQDPHIEEPASADESEFGVEPAKLLEQTLTTDDVSCLICQFLTINLKPSIAELYVAMCVVLQYVFLFQLSNRRSSRASTMSSGMEMQQRRPRSSTTDHSSIVPTSMPSDSMGSHPPDSPPGKYCFCNRV